MPPCLRSCDCQFKFETSETINKHGIGDLRRVGGNAYHCLYSVTVKLNILYPFLKRQILGPSKLKEFADDNLIFDENVRKISKCVENTVGKGEIASYEQFFLFPQYFQRTLTANT